MFKGRIRYATSSSPHRALPPINVPPQRFSYARHTHLYYNIIMPAPTTTLLIEGSFDELVDELAQYIDNLKKAQGDEGSNLQAECAQLLQENKKDDVLKKLVTGSPALNQAPEKGEQDQGWVYTLY